MRKMLISSWLYNDAASGTGTVWAVSPARLTMLVNYLPRNVVSIYLKVPNRHLYKQHEENCAYVVRRPRIGGNISSTFNSSE